MTGAQDHIVAAMEPAAQKRIKEMLAAGILAKHGQELAHLLEESASLGVIASMTICGHVVIPLDEATALLRGELT